MKRLTDLLPEFSKRRFERLPDEQKLAVGDAYLRHAKACRAHGMEPDPLVLIEMISEVAAGRNILV